MCDSDIWLTFLSLVMTFVMTCIAHWTLSIWEHKFANDKETKLVTDPPTSLQNYLFNDFDMVYVDSLVQ